jgi:hypothetical protein
MNPLDQNQGQQGMMYSKSTSALLNRLKPQNENVSSATLSSSASQSRGLNTMKPKALGVSSSTPQLQIITPVNERPNSPTHNLDITAASLKVSKLRGDVNNGNVLSKTLSNSPSAMLLSPNAQVRSQFPNNLTSADMPLAPGDRHFIDASFSRQSNRNKLPDSPVNNVEACTYDLLPPGDATVSTDTDAKINVHKSSFLGSLNMTQKQLHDLYKVPHTFFYLRVRQTPATTTLSATNSPTVKGPGSPVNKRIYTENSDYRGNSGSVYDLELVSLDQVDKNDYFTLSKEGVTQFRYKVSQFTGLSQWEREYRLFHKIANINFFKIYKRWKVSPLSPSPRPPDVNPFFPYRLSQFGERAYVLVK